MRGGGARPALSPAQEWAYAGILYLPVRLPLTHLAVALTCWRPRSSAPVSRPPPGLENLCPKCRNAWVTKRHHYEAAGEMYMSSLSPTFSWRSEWNVNLP